MNYKENDKRKSSASQPIVGNDSAAELDIEESISLVFANRPTTLNDKPIYERSLIQNADVIRVSGVATTFDGVVIDGLIRAVDTGAGMVYEPTVGELSSQTGSDLLDDLLRVNLQFVKTGTQEEISLPNLTARFWDIDETDANETAEVVGFSNADCVDVVSPFSDASDEIEKSGSFLADKLRYRLQAPTDSFATTERLETSTHKQDNDIANLAGDSPTYDFTSNSGINHPDDTAALNFDDASDDVDCLDYRVTAQFKEFTSTDIAYGITRSLCTTAIVCGLKLNGLSIHRSINSTVGSIRGTGRQKRVVPSSQSKPITSVQQADKKEMKNERTDVRTSDQVSILFVDTRVPDYNRIFTSVKPGMIVRSLRTTADGIEQMTSFMQHYLSEYRIHAIHIVAQSLPGCLYLGNGELNLRTLDRYRQQIAAWQSDIIYLQGCDVAKGEVGHYFISKLEEFSNALVIAPTSLMLPTSADVTGHTISSYGFNRDRFSECSFSRPGRLQGNIFNKVRSYLN